MCMHLFSKLMSMIFESCQLQVFVVHLSVRCLELIELFAHHCDADHMLVVIIISVTAY